MWTNDINQGRPHAHGVPESDQWDSEMKMPKIARKNQEPIYHKKQVMSDNNGPGVYRQIQDEIFLSQQCLRYEAGLHKGQSMYPNPHDGRIENDRYCFHFPATWYYSHTVGKAIGLRRITLLPRWYNFRLAFDITKLAGTQAGTRNIQCDVNITPTMNMGVVADTLTTTINQAITAAVGAGSRNQWVNVRAPFNSDLRRFQLIWRPNGGGVAANFQYRFDPPNCVGLDEFFDMLNCPPEERIQYITAPIPSFPTMTFTNVWNREPDQLCFHASFVNHTQFNYLGKHGDFYTKPSKIYSADNLPMDFYFWMSTDIMHPIVLPFERFIIALAFIIDSHDYQSP
jgi:hypothetical protein